MTEREHKTDESPCWCNPDIENYKNGKRVFVTSINNFCRVFELPTTFSEEFCFSGGIPTTFMMVDWFQPIPVEDVTNNKVKSWSEYIPKLKEFLVEKTYVKPGKTYLLITDFGESFLFGGDG